MVQHVEVVEQWEMHFAFGHTGARFRHAAAIVGAFSYEVHLGFITNRQVKTGCGWQKTGRRPLN